MSKKGKKKQNRPPNEVPRVKTTPLAPAEQAKPISGVKAFFNTTWGIVAGIGVIAGIVALGYAIYRDKKMDDREKPRLDVVDGILAPYQGMNRFESTVRNFGTRPVDNIVVKIFFVSNIPSLTPFPQSTYDQSATLAGGADMRHTLTFRKDELTPDQMFNSYLIIRLRYRDIEEEKIDSSFVFGKFFSADGALRFLRITAAERSDIAERMKKMRFPENIPFPWQDEKF